MGRIVVQEARILDLTWNEEKRYYVLRLLHGNKFVTPKLPLTPLDFLRLMQRQDVKLGDWVKLYTDRSEMILTHIKGYERWQPVIWHQFSLMARNLRGEEPESDWQYWDEKLAEAEREKHQ